MATQNDVEVKVDAPVQPLKATGKAFTVGLWLLLIAGAAITVTVFWVGSHNVEQFKGLGTWGDFVGGLLNPILTFITFIAVILTIWLQRAELTLTRDEMVRSANALEEQGRTLRKQSFENTFFEMLRLHNTIIEGIDLVKPETGVVTRGRDAFSVFYTRLTKIYREMDAKKRGKTDEKTLVQRAYFTFWKDAQNELGHYFRFLFNYFRFFREEWI